MLSNTCKYAIRAAVFIAVNQKDNERIGIKRIAEELNLPLPFLSKVLQLLAKKDILMSTKGPHGGFALAKNSFDITFYDIVEVIDGNGIFEGCMLGLELCRNNPDYKKTCPIHPFSEPVRQSLLALFKEQTLGHAANNFSEVKIKFDL